MTQKKKYMLNILVILVFIACFLQTAQAKEPEMPVLDEKVLYIPGIQEDYDLLFLADTHIITLDGTEDRQTTENAVPRYFSFVNPEGVPAEYTFAQWIDYANHTKPDCILLGGDIIDFPSGANIQKLSALLSSSEIPYAYALGNHDWTYPWDYMTDHGIKTYLPKLMPFTGPDPAASVTDCGEFLILAVDNSSNHVNPQAMETVQQAFSAGKPVILMLHVPFSTPSLIEKAENIWKNPVSMGLIGEKGVAMNKSTKQFRNMVLSEASPVVCVLAGHVHFADDSPLNKRVMQYTTGPGYQQKAVMLHIIGTKKGNETCQIK